MKKIVENKTHHSSGPSSMKPIKPIKNVPCHTAFPEELHLTKCEIPEFEIKAV